MEERKKRARSELPAEDNGAKSSKEQDEEVYELNNEVEEAIEDRPEIVEEEEVVESEPEGEELLEGMEEEYKAIPALDAYEITPADEEEVEELSPEERKKAEQELNERDIEKIKQNKRIPAALYEEMEELSEEGELRKQARDRQKKKLAEDEGKEAEGTEMIFDMEETKGKVRDWIKSRKAETWVHESFISFLRNYRDQDHILTYDQRIREMCINNKQSLEVTYTHLAEKWPSLALWLAEYPAIIIPYLCKAAWTVVIEIFPTHGEIHQEVFVKVRDLPVEDKLRELRQTHLKGLVKIRGVITKRTSVYPQYKEVFLRCPKCDAPKGPFVINLGDEIKLGPCDICRTSGKMFNIDQERTLYKNYQKITIQETPGTVPPGRVPRQKDVVLLNDNIDIARPGDEVEITGIYMHYYDYCMNIKHGFPVFSTSIEANYVRRLGDMESTEITAEDVTEIQKLSKSPNIDQRIYASIAPSIYGHEFIKTALALAVFGGVPKDIAGKHKIRGDINVLLLGDPGTAKSQFLKYIEKAVHRCVYTTGKGASAVGLTAGVRKDFVSREWILEGGALVLADKGMCLIDEFDKMNDQDRTSIHEAMEQQSISISKAGIVTTLQARCSVVAAANPLGGKYDGQKSFNENVDLTDPILSRFDLLAVIKDEVDEAYDRDLASFVINSHIRSHPGATEENVVPILLEEKMKTNEPIPQDLFKKYVLHAKRSVHPKLGDIEMEKITRFYTELRREAQSVGGLPIGVRHVESILRMSEAHAKMHLSDHVTAADVDVAIRMMLESFLMSQKYSVSKSLEKKFNKFLTSNKDGNQLLYHLLSKLMNQKLLYLQTIQPSTQMHDISVSIAQLDKEAKENNLVEIQSFFKSHLFNSKYILDKNQIKLK